MTDAIIEKYGKNIPHIDIVKKVLKMIPWEPDITIYKNIVTEDIAPKIKIDTDILHNPLLTSKLKVEFGLHPLDQTSVDLLNKYKKDLGKKLTDTVPSSNIITDIKDINWKSSTPYLLIGGTAVIVGLISAALFFPLAAIYLVPVLITLIILTI